MIRFSLTVIYTSSTENLQRHSKKDIIGIKRQRVENGEIKTYNLAYNKKLGSIPKSRPIQKSIFFSFILLYYSLEATLSTII